MSNNISTTVTTTIVTEINKEKDKTQNKEIYDVYVLDRSGSMASIWKSTIDGLNEYLNKSKRIADEKNIKTFISLLKFDDDFKVVYTNTPINEVKQLDYETDGPRGGTALNDAIGRAITNIKEHLKGRENSDNVDVTITIFTDGYENASKEFNQKTIADLIKKVRDEYKWTVAYVGAGDKEDVERISISYNIDITNTASYVNSPEDTKRMFAANANSRMCKTMAYADLGIKKAEGYFNNNPVE